MVAVMRVVIVCPLDRLQLVDTQKQKEKMSQKRGTKFLMGEKDAPQ